MKKEFDFDKVNKRMPYSVPPDFFNTITEQTLTEIERRNAVAHKNSFQFLWKAVSVAASVVALLTIGYFIYNASRQNSQPLAESAVVAPSTSSSGSGSLRADAEEIPLPVQPAATDQPETNKTRKAEATAENQPERMADASTPETLDQVLSDISDEELLLLAAIAESDLYVHQQTFEQ